MNLKNYFSELKRRNVIKAALAYLVLAWLIIQVLSIILPTFEAPPYLLKLSIIILAIGFPIWLVFSWVYDFTSEGLKKTSDVDYDESFSKLKGKKLSAIIIGTLSIVVVILSINLFSPKAENSNLSEIRKEKIDTRNSIAILPFANLSDVKDNTFFTEGMHQDVLNKLAGLKELRVIARTSVMGFKGFQGRLDSLGIVLNTKYFVEGTVRKYENQIRVSVNLIEAATNETLWSENYDRKLKNVFSIQNEIAQEIVDNLKTNISSTEVKELSKIPTENIKAYENYLMARNILNGYYETPQLSNAINYLNKAVKEDSNFIDAWSLLAKSNSDLYERSLSFEDNSMSIKAKEEAERALLKLTTIASNSAPHLRAKGYYENMVLKDPIKALQSFDKAIELVPNDAPTILYQGIMYAYLGQIRKGIENMERAYAVDNQNGLIRYILPSTYSNMGEYQKLINIYSDFLKQDPEKTHYAVEIKYYQFLLEGSIKSFKDLENSISTIRLTDRCDLETVKENKMVVAMFNNDYENYAANWIGKWDSHHADHGNWSCPAIINDELNQANLMVQNNKLSEAQKIIKKATETIEKPINEKSVCVFNVRVYKPKLDYLLGDKLVARAKFDAIITDVMNLNKFPRGLVERKVLLETADLIAPDVVYSIYKQVTSKELSMVSLETVCANPWKYPNLLKDPNFQKEVKKDGRFVDFLKMNKIL